MEDDNSVTESYQSHSGTSRTPVSRQDSGSVAESRESRSAPFSGTASRTPVSRQDSDSVAESSQSRSAQSRTTSRTPVSRQDSDVAESRQSRSAQSSNNPRTPVSRQDSDSVAESRQSRAQSGNNPRTPVSRQASSADDLDIFQSYSRFRLKVVSMFGSMASGLYELGADPQTGRISQEDFVRVCADTLEMMSEREALSLFRHFTNADPFGAEDEAFATFKDLSIDEEEWKYVVATKQQAKTNSTAIPFSSVPSGSSAGLYHRPINVNQVSEQREQRQALSSEDGTPRSPVRRSGTARSFKRSLPPWRQPQKPYAPSMMAGQGIASIEAKTVLVFRPRGGEFWTTGRSTLDGPWIKDRFITQRKPEWRTEAWRCPTSREEMQPQVCAKQVLDWWPYLSPRPAPKVRLKRRPIDR